MASCYIKKKNTSTLCSSKCTVSFIQMKAKPKLKSVQPSVRLRGSWSFYIPEGLALELLQLHHPRHNSERSVALPALGSRLLPQSSSTNMVGLSQQHPTPCTSFCVKVSVTVKKYHDHSNLERKEFILLIIPYSSLPLKDIRAGTPGRNL